MYSYEEHKPAIFTERGQVEFLKTRDHVHALLNKAGACTMGQAMCAGCDTWQMMAYVDRLVELGELREIEQGEVCGQHRVFVVGPKWDYGTQR